MSFIPVYTVPPSRFSFSRQPCFGPHRALPSFPTRRSSDLGITHVLSSSLKALSADPNVDGVFLIQGALDVGVGGERSEEHTSELQSRGHLVCRLLLEKKKQSICRKITDTRKHEKGYGTHV